MRSIDLKIIDHSSECYVSCLYYSLFVEIVRDKKFGIILYVPTYRQVGKFVFFYEREPL